ncbi:MAG TPA: acyl-CoA dehydrogenase family protein [Bacillota bacterium]|nr:acyl-CoA dehydrogenase family protein [Bacillota bacterium]
MVDLLLNEDDKLLKDMLQKFAEKEIAPLATKRDEEEYFDWNAFHKMGESGLTGVPWPVKYGGAGMDYVSFIRTVEELSKVCGATGSDIAIHTALASWPIFTFGTEKQKENYLHALASGQKLGAFSLTEPNYGSDYTKLATRAEKDGDGYILNGNKVFTSNAVPAEIYTVFALTDKASNHNGYEGLSAFIIEKDTDGFTIGKPEKKMGIRGHVVSSLNFDNCRIPTENLLGEEGQGHQIAKRTLQGGRLAMSAQALGLATGAYEQALSHVSNRTQFDKPLTSFQSIQFKLAKMAIQLETSRLLVYKAAKLMDKGEDYSIASSMAKAYVSKMAMNLTTEAVQLFGGYGYTREYPVERMMRDTKITQIYTGTVEMQLNEIADSILA